MKELVESIARALADDVGKMIGKSGKTIGAIRALLAAIAHRSGRRALIEVAQ